MTLTQLPIFEDDYGILSEMFHSKFNFLKQIDLEIIEAYLSDISSHEVYENVSEAQVTFDESRILYRNNTSEILIYQEYATGRIFLNFNPLSEKCPIFNREIAKALTMWNNIQYVNDIENDNIVILYEGSPLAIYKP